MTTTETQAQELSPRGYPLAPTGGEDGRPMTAFEAQEFYERLFDVQLDLKLPEGARLIVDRDKRSFGGRFYFQVEVTRRDIVTGELGVGRSGKAYLSPEQTLSELVQCAFGLWSGYWLHESRETFEWRERRVFGPHVDVNEHWKIAQTYDARPQQRRGDPVGDLLAALRDHAADLRTAAIHTRTDAGMNGDPTDGGAWLMEEDAYALDDAVKVIGTELDPVAALIAKATDRRDIDPARDGHDVAAIYEAAAGRLAQILNPASPE